MGAGDTFLRIHNLFENLGILMKIRKNRRAATTKPRQIKCSGLFPLDHKGQTQDWSQVNRMLGCGEIAIFQPRMMIWKSVLSNFVGPPQLNRGR